MDGQNREQMDLVNDDRQETNRYGKMFSRRAIIASLGMATAAVASGGLVHTIHASGNPHDKIGDLLNLETREKSNLVGAINEYAVQLAEMAINVKAEPYNATGDGTTDDTAAIQAAIDACGTAGGGIVLAPEGVYMVSNLFIPSYVELYGVGKKTTFKQKANSTGAVIQLRLNSSQMIGLYHFRVDGNRSNQSNANKGIHLVNTTDYQTMISASSVGEHDARHWVEHVYIYETKGDGFSITGRGESQIKGLQTLRCDGRGIVVNSADTWWTDCSAGDSGLEGIAVEAAATNNRLVNCKSWFSGRITRSSGDGIAIKANRTSLTACESQDNSKHGFVFGAADIVASALIAEANGWQYETGIQLGDGTGFLFYGAQNCNVQGMACDRFSPKSHQTYGMQFLGGSLNNFMILTSRQMKTSAMVANQFNTNNNRYIITEIKIDGTSKQWSNVQHLNVNMDNMEYATAAYIRSLTSLGHTLGLITRFDSDAPIETVQRWEKYNNAGDLKSRWDLEIDHAAKNAKMSPVDGGWFEFDSILKTAESTWNGKHLMLGEYHLWVDSTGKLRMKNGSPVSDTDGTVVGTHN